MRAALLGRPKQFKRRMVTVRMAEGEEPVEVEVRQPTIRERSEIGRQCVQVIEQGGRTATAVDGFKLRLRSVLVCCYVPGTDERIFEDADLENLAGYPSGCYVDELAETALELQNLSDAEDAGKNSKATPDAS